jgi:hypothetical protein
MIDLMLDDTCSEISQCEHIFLPIWIEKCNLDPFPSLDVTAFTRDRKASFFVSTSERRVFCDDRIDHCNGTKVFVIIGSHKRYDDEAFIDPDLRCCESYSTIIGVFDMFYHFFRE